jgi:hypothetical protein
MGANDCRCWVPVECFRSLLPTNTLDPTLRRSGTERVEGTPETNSIDRAAPGKPIELRPDRRNQDRPRAFMKSAHVPFDKAGRLWHHKLVRPPGLGWLAADARFGNSRVTAGVIQVGREP